MRTLNRLIQGLFNRNEVRRYWTNHNVTSHCKFTSKEESLEYFHWRNDQYFDYIDLMPVVGFDGKNVLDFGCGPGNDLVGLGTYSKCARLVGADISSSSVEEARARLSLHGILADVVLLKEDSAEALPFEDQSFDHIHCSGVLHHTSEPIQILQQLKRLLKPNGTMNVMVYNFESIWVHLYVAYMRTLVEGLYEGEPLTEQFRHSTDGESCPISNCYRPDEWISICKSAGLNAKFTGAAISAFELSILDKRFAAIMDRRLPTESRKFLTSFEFNNKGIPKYNGATAGIDACFELSLP